MARANIKLNHPITELELDLDENSLEFLWISVKDQLPEKEGKVLVVYTQNEMFKRYSWDVVSFTKNLEDLDQYDFEGQDRPGFYYYDSEWGYCEKSGVTHWMPLPGLPDGCKEKKEEVGI